jgi:hypothetical protein
VPFRQCDFQNAYLDFCDLEAAVLCSTNLSQANLSNSNLQNADLTNANLSGANLTHTCLKGAILLGANLENVIFRDTSYDQLTVFDPDFSPEAVGLTLDYSEISQPEKQPPHSQGVVKASGLSYRGSKVKASSPPSEPHRQSIAQEMPEQTLFYRGIQLSKAMPGLPQSQDNEPDKPVEGLTKVQPKRRLRHGLI